MLNVKIGLRLPQAGEGHTTKENIISLAKGADSFLDYQPEETDL
jgi:hypothetical protein